MRQPSVASTTRHRAVLAACVAAIDVATALVGCATAPVETAPAPVRPVASAPAVIDEAPLDAAQIVDAAVPPDARRIVRRDPAQLFDPRRDREVLASLRTEEIVLVERGRGGRSLAFRVTLASGARAYFKPEQTFSGTHWYAEIAAFHLDRALDLRRTAPSTGRVIPWSLLEPAAAGDPRIGEIVVGDDGMVRGALVAWIEERLVPIEPPEDWMAALRVEPAAGPSPFVAGRILRRARTARDAGLDGGWDAGPDATSDAPDADLDGGLAETMWDDEGRAAELSDLIVFDYLLQNGDRWGGNFTNVRTRGADGPLVYLDNAAGFTRRRPRAAVVDSRLGFVQRFSAGLVERLRAFDVTRFARRLEGDPLAPLLDEEQLGELEGRRVAVVGHVDRLAARLGQERVLSW